MMLLKHLLWPCFMKVELIVSLQNLIWKNMILMGLEIPLIAIRQQIASGLDIIVHLGRLRDKSRRVLEISEIVGCENNEIKLNPLYEFEEAGEDSNGKIVGRLNKTGDLLRKNKLKAAGLL